MEEKEKNTLVIKNNNCPPCMTLNWKLTHRITQSFVCFHKRFLSHPNVFFHAFIIPLKILECFYVAFIAIEAYAYTTNFQL